MKAGSGLAIGCLLAAVGTTVPGMEAASVGAKDVPLGHPDFQPSPERPVGWLGDWTGRYPGAADFPLEWDTTTGENILWKTQLPEGGHSSPIVVGNPSTGSGRGRVFLTCEPDLTVCLDAETGKILWQASGEALRKRKSGIYHDATGFSMGTACSDGQNVFVTHYNGVVMSYDLAGKARWRKDVPPLGWSGASPVLVDGKFIVLQGTGKVGAGDSAKIGLHGPYDLVAYACETGDVVWRNTGVYRMSGWHYDGPAPMWVGGRPYVVNFHGQFFDARDGRLAAQLFREKTKYGPLLWLPAVEGDTAVFALSVWGPPGEWRKGLQDLAAANPQEPLGMEDIPRRDVTPLVNKKGKFVRDGITSFHGWHDAIVMPVKVLADGKGGLSFETPWRPVVFLGRSCDVATLTVADGIAYHRGDGNHSAPGMTVYDFRNGKVLSPGGFDGMAIVGTRPATNGLFGGALLYSHPVVAGDYLTVSDCGGRTHVFNRAPDLRQVAENLTEWTRKPPAGNPISGPAGGLESSEFYQGNRIYFRHWDTLYCMGDPRAAEHAAAFAAARGHAEGGRIADAQKAYRALWNARPLHVRYRAIREMAAVLGDRAAEELMLAFRHSDTNTRALALTVASKAASPVMTRQLAAGLSDGDPGYRCLLLEALRRRGEPVADALLTKALRDPVAEVRLAAIAACGGIGDAAAVQALVAQCAQFNESERVAVIKALAAIRDPAVDAYIAGQIPQASPPVRAALLRVLGQRGATAQVQVIVKEVGHADPDVRLAAMDAAGQVGGMAELPALIERLRLTVPDADRTAIGEALSRIRQRVRAEDYAATLIRALGTVNGAGRAVLLRAVGPAGGAVALAEVRRALADRDEVQRRAAVEALAAWPDLSAKPDLVALVSSEKNATNLANVARGLVRIVEMTPPAATNEVYRLYESALRTGQNMIPTIVHLERQNDVRTIELLTRFLGSKDTEPAIVSAMRNVAGGAADKDARATIAALLRATEAIADARLRGDLDKYTEGLRIQRRIQPITPDSVDTLQLPSP
jgi:HEAT repeat protein